MKKFIVPLVCVSLFVVSSCGNKTAEAKKEIIVVPATPVVVVQESQPKSTTVTLDKNGVKVSTKKVNVAVKNN